MLAKYIEGKDGHRVPGHGDLPLCSGAAAPPPGIGFDGLRHGALRGELLKNGVGNRVIALRKTKLWITTFWKRCK